MKRSRTNIFANIISKLHLNNPKVIWCTVIAAILIGVAVVIGSGKTGVPSRETTHSAVEDVEYFIEETEVDDSEDDFDDHYSRQKENSITTPEPAKEAPEDVVPAPTPKSDVEIAREIEKETSIDDSSDRLYSMGSVELPPSFPGGEPELFKYLSAHINYPASAAEDGISGRVIVQFVISKDGSVSDVEVIRSRHPALDAEAVRVVRSMPRWIPGKKNGQPVNVSYSLPVTFKLS